MSYIRTNTISTVTATGVLPNVDIILIGSGATTITGTVPTNSMIAGQAIQIKRNIGSTGTITVQGTGTNQIQALGGTVGATTSIGLHSATGIGLSHAFTAINIGGVGVWVRC